MLFEIYKQLMFFVFRCLINHKELDSIAKNSFSYIFKICKQIKVQMFERIFTWKHFYFILCFVHIFFSYTNPFI